MKKICNVFCFSLMIFIVSEGCIIKTATLIPIKHVEESVPDKSVTIEVRPVLTQGLYSKDKKRYKIDLSSYFTVFNINIINNTDKTIRFDYNKIYLIDDIGKEYKSLNKEEAIKYYRYGDKDPQKFRVIIQKPISLIRSEMKKIENLMIRPEEISPDSELERLIFFKKVLYKKCSYISMVINGVRVEGENKNKKFTFKFRCD